MAVGGRSMQQIRYCPTKDKKVIISRTVKNAGDLENPNQIVEGRFNCSENNYLCDYEKCPIQKMKY